MAEKESWEEKSHENVVFSCFGGFSNTGITSALACLGVVKELGLEKVAIGCLSAVPLGVEPVLGKTKVAKKIITVDGCPFECAKKTLENAGFKIMKSIVLVRDIGMKKVPLHTDIGKGLGVEKYISQEEIEKAKELITKAIMEE